MLTTKDNPYSPFDQFDLWQMYDNAMGYQTSERLGKIIQIEDDMSDQEKEEAMDRAIDEIIQYDPLGIYCRAYENSTFPIGE